MCTSLGVSVAGGCRRPGLPSAAHPGLGLGGADTRALRCGAPWAGLGGADTKGSKVRRTLGWAWGADTNHPWALRCGAYLDGLGDAGTQGSHVRHTLGWVVRRTAAHGLGWGVPTHRA